MEYYRKLVDLEVLQDNADKVLAVRILASPPMRSPEYDEFNKRTRKEEAERRRVLDRHERCITVVEDLERRLDIGVGERWTPGSDAWMAAVTLTREYQYRKLLNRLQGLIDIRDAPWAKPGARSTLDLYFQLLRAEEERERLNVEIKRWYHEHRLKEEGQAARALQVHEYRMLQGRFYGSIEPGVGLCRIHRAVLEHRDAVLAAEEPVAGVEAALAASAAAENQTGGDDGGAQDVDDPSDDEVDTDTGFETVLNVAEDGHGTSILWGQGPDIGAVGGQGGQIGLTAPQANIHGVGTGGTAAVGGQGDISQDIDGGGTLRGTSHAQYTHGGGTLRGTSRARYTRGGGTNGTFFFTVWDGITCLVHLRWGDKRDIFFPVVGGCGIASRARYIHGAGTGGTCSAFHYKRDVMVVWGHSDL
ncbi:hypothetical protein B0H16DRAFT_1856228 [Mycena metata]|uniref:Uncharacterized protein n=1 Tax=Mycena metata TaxID=1033252 RepID=A0AAD7IMP5_9AGAR|nr:hypothetical protein B0H16DRAFT_1856228 [Mycena metata]